MPKPMDHVQKVENIIEDYFIDMQTYSIYSNMCKHKNLYDVISYNPEVAQRHLQNFKAFW